MIINTYNRLIYYTIYSQCTSQWKYLDQDNDEQNYLVNYSSIQKGQTGKVMMKFDV